MAPLQLRLYIAGNAPNSLKARRNLESFLADYDVDSYQLEIIDCLSEPGRTLADGIVVTPTLRRVSPGPTGTVIGSLADTDGLRALMGRRPRE